MCVIHTIVSCLAWWPESLLVIIPSLPFKCGVREQKDHLPEKRKDLALTKLEHLVHVLKKLSNNTLTGSWVFNEYYQCYFQIEKLTIAQSCPPFGELAFFFSSHHLSCDEMKTRLCNEMDSYRNVFWAFLVTTTSTRPIKFTKFEQKIFKFDNYTS